jgi:hypothetical protein
VSRRGIRIFHDDDAAARMLNKHRNGSALDLAFFDLRLDLTGDFVQTFAMGAYFELIVMDVHVRNANHRR